jgi:hypothetical protein
VAGAAEVFMLGGGPPPSMAARAGGRPSGGWPSCPERPPMSCWSMRVMGSSSWAGWSGAVSTPGGGAPARRRARMSASVGGVEVLELG